MSKLLNLLKEKGCACHANSNVSEYLNEKDLLKIENQVESQLKTLLETLLIDYLEDPNSRETPKRVAKMLVRETMCGRFDPAPKVTVFPNTEQLDEMVFTKCDVKSACSHHMQPIIGHCYIGILYNEKLMGLSKFDRIVDWFSRRGQIQEELTSQIAHYIQEMIEPQALGVIIKANHYCKICRGVKQEGGMITSVMLGELKKNPSMKEEFLNMVKML
jgi:GTP cyclohydrolase IA